MRDYMLRQVQAQQAAGEQRCGQCPHLVLDHRELPPGTPGYAPLVFCCAAPRCGCRLDLNTELAAISETTRRLNKTAARVRKEAGQ